MKLPKYLFLIMCIGQKKRYISLVTFISFRGAVFQIFDTTISIFEQDMSGLL